MAHIDARSGEVVIRIVYDGASSAGKSANIEQLRALISQQRSGLVRKHPGAAGERTSLFDWLEFAGGYVDGRRVRYQILSTPGLPEFGRRRRWLLASADVIVFVADARKDLLAETCDALPAARAAQDEGSAAPVNIVLQANKRDLDGGLSPTVLAAALGLPDSTPVVPSVVTRGEGVMATFVFASRLATDRVRLQILADALLPRESPEDAESLQALLEDVALEPRSAVAPWPVRRNLIESPGALSMPVPGELASGHVWPPVKGRAALGLALGGSIDAPRFVLPWAPAGAQELVSSAGFALHSSERWSFSDESAARLALLNHARQLLSLGSLLPDARSLAVAKQTGGWRLWLVTPLLRSLAEDVFAAAQADDAHALASFAARLKGVRRRLEEAGSTGRAVPGGAAGLTLHEGRFLALSLDEAAPHSLEANDPLADLARLLRDLCRGAPALEAWFERDGRSFVERELEVELDAGAVT